MNTSFWKDKAAWRQASRNTFYCLVGCSIGDFGTIIFMQIYFPKVSIFPVMGLAMIVGIITSILFEMTMLHFKEGFLWKEGLKMAWSMSLFSMIVMELAENATDYFLTNGTISPTEVWYWIALLFSLAAGFFVPLPYNYYKFKKYQKTCH